LDVRVIGEDGGSGAWLGEVPPGEQRGLFRFDPGQATRFRAVAAASGGEVLAETAFLVGPPLKPRAQRNRVEWDKHSWEHVLIQPARWVQGRLAADEAVVSVTNGCTVKNNNWFLSHAVQMRLTPFSADGRQGTSQTLTLGPVRPRIRVVFERVVENNFFFARITVEELGTCIRPPIFVVLTRYHPRNATSETELEWNEQGTATLDFREILTGDSLAVKTRETEVELVYWEQTRDGNLVRNNSSFMYRPL
jgi:hypothetical protein